MSEKSPEPQIESDRPALEVMREHRAFYDKVTD